jgi:guanine nucleotide-binding protein subunit alpha
MHLQTAEIERRIELETKAEKHIQKLLLLGTFYGRFSLNLSLICLMFH